MTAPVVSNQYINTYVDNEPIMSIPGLVPQKYKGKDVQHYRITLSLTAVGDQTDTTAYIVPTLAQYHYMPDRGVIYRVRCSYDGKTNAMATGKIINGYFASRLYMTDTQIALGFCEGMEVVDSTVARVAGFENEHDITGLWIPFDDDDFLWLIGIMHLLDDTDEDVVCSYYANIYCMKED